MKQNNPIDRCLKNESNACVQKICDCAVMVSKSTKLAKIQKDLFSDLLDRIHRNYLSLNKLFDIDSEYLIIRLLQRTIIVDIITCLFFSSLVDDVTAFDDALAVVNSKSMNSIDEWMEEHYKIDCAKANISGKEYISKEDYFESYNHYKQGFSNLTLKECRINNKIFKGNPRNMYSCTKDENIHKAIKYLYTEYRFLSQIEHYSIFNRGFSFIHPGDNSIDIHKSVINYCLNYLFDVIEELVGETNSN